jgi:hypothetical protein
MTTVPTSDTSAVLDKNNNNNNNEVGKENSFEYTEFQRCSLCHITGDDISRTTKGIINAAMVLEATMVSSAM